MTLDEIFKVVGAILAALGGGTVVVTAAIKWCSDLLAQKMLSDIEHKHEKEIEKYKAELQDFSAEFNALVEQSMQVASKQYDMEIEIYQNIWKTFHELSMCQNYIYHFENITMANPDDYLAMLEKYAKDFKMNMEKFQEQINSVAPFYQIEAYELLCDIEEQYIVLLDILESSIGLAGMSEENKIKVENEVLPQIEQFKDKLIKTIRNYLFSLKRITR